MKIVVVGADKGLGAELCELLLQEGHAVGVGLLSGVSGTGTIWESKHHDNALMLHTDVSDENTMKLAAEQVSRVFGCIDAVINVAGVLMPGDRVNDVLHMDPMDLQTSLQVNAVGILITFRAFYPLVRRGKEGEMIAITSEGGSFVKGASMFPAYSVSKTAANKMVQIMRNTMTDVKILAVHPGRMNTEMGRTTAQIEPQEAARGIVDIVSGKKSVDSDREWFIDYQGKSMPLC